MSAPRVVALRAGSPAERAGMRTGDELVTIDGTVPRDVIDYQMLSDDEDPEITVRRQGSLLSLSVKKPAGTPVGIEVHSALFDRVRTCDNHCEFCFIYQLPKGMRRSLYQKDDDYRLSFLYGNFTTLTRFTELDLERIVTERLSPLFVSIHATDPGLRARMLRNPRGATSLRWLSALLDAGIEVHGQVVVCPGVNDGDWLEDTLAGILDRFPALATLACVPLGVSRFSAADSMRPHTVSEARSVLETVTEWQGIFRRTLARPMVFAADEYYLLAGLPFPEAGTYDGFPQHENGIGMARAFIESFRGDTTLAHGSRPGFFAWVDGAPSEGYRAPRAANAHITSRPPLPGPAEDDRVVVLTGEYGAAVIAPLVRELDDMGCLETREVSVQPVVNHFFGGNIKVTGLLTGADISEAIDSLTGTPRILLPDVCLSEGRFLDGLTLADLPRRVEVVPSDGASLRLALAGGR